MRRCPSLKEATRRAVRGSVAMSVVLTSGLCLATNALGSVPAAAQNPCGTYGSYSGNSCKYTVVGQDTFTVPVGVSNLQVVAQGGHAQFSSGAKVTADIPVAGAAVDDVEVGVGGGASVGVGGSGGGLSGIYRSGCGGTTDTSCAVLVAGGGGGYGLAIAGQTAGGDAGWGNLMCNTAPSGGSGDGGGAAGGCSSGGASGGGTATAGGAGAGGRGGCAIVENVEECGGSGGGGYYGGGGGYPNGGGGGGSSFAEFGATGVSMVLNSASPSVIISWTPAPIVTGLSPTSGPTIGGNVVTISGTDFTGASAVRFGTNDGTHLVVVSASTIKVTVPAGTGTVDVTVTTRGGTSAKTPADRFTYVLEEGYWLAVSSGGVYGAGSAASLGGVASSVATPTNPVVGIAGTPDGGGYVVATANGTVKAFGDAKFYGDLPSMHIHPNLPVVAIADTADGGGYWLLASDGGFFAFGNAKYRGSVPGLGQKVSDVVAMEASPVGIGYWMAAGDGTVWNFGSAGFYGDLPSLHVRPNRPVVAMLPSTTGKGYVLVASDGGTFKFGSGVHFYGSLPGIGVKVTDVIGLALTPDDGGYFIAATNGLVWGFGDATAQPTPAGLDSHLPVVAIAGV